MINFKNINTEKYRFFVILSVYSITFGLAVLLSYFTFKNLKQTEKIKSLENANLNYAADIKEKINNAVSTVSLFSKTISRKKFCTSKLTAEIFSDILKNNENIAGIYLFSGKISKTTGENPFFLNDSANTAKSLHVFAKNKNIVVNNNELPGFFYDIVDFDKLTKNKRFVFLSEPFEIKKTKNKTNVIAVTLPVNCEENGGFLSFMFKSDYFMPFSFENKNIKFLLLTPEKNILASSFSSYNIGKNIENLHGKEKEFYEKSLKYNNLGYGIFKINPQNSDTEFTLVVYAEKISETGKTGYLPFFLILFLLFVAGVFSVMIFSKKIFYPLKDIEEKTNKIKKGEKFDEKINTDLSDFIRISENLKVISDFDKEIKHFAEEILKEKYDIRLKERSSADYTTKTLNKIPEKLSEKEKIQKEKEEKTSQQLWMRKGRFEISEAERFSSKKIEDLSFNIIRSVVNYIDALMGGLYLYDEETDTVKLVAAYAYDKQRHINAEFKKGEGIVGACIVEKKKIILNKIPENYIKAETGIGNGTPSFLAVIPVFFKNKINAAIEIAFMKEPEEYKIEFVEQLSDNIGAWIDASITGTKTAKLLEISQKQTKELAEKEEELNKKVAELQEIQEKTAELNVRYKSILNAVNQTVMTVEYTLDGTIVNCNSVYTEVMGFEVKDIKGKNVSDLVKDQTESLMKIINEVKNGKTVKKQVKRYTKSGEEKQLTATYTPLYDKNEKIVRILFFAFDISDIK